MIRIRNRFGARCCGPSAATSAGVTASTAHSSSPSKKRTPTCRRCQIENATTAAYSASGGSRRVSSGRGRAAAPSTSWRAPSPAWGGRGSRTAYPASARAPRSSPRRYAHDGHAAPLGGRARSPSGGAGRRRAVAPRARVDPDQRHLAAAVRRATTRCSSCGEEVGGDQEELASRRDRRGRPRAPSTSERRPSGLHRRELLERDAPVTLERRPPASAEPARRGDHERRAAAVGGRAGGGPSPRRAPSISNDESGALPATKSGARVEHHRGLVARRVLQLLHHQLLAARGRAPVHAPQRLAVLVVAHGVQVEAGAARQQVAPDMPFGPAALREQPVELVGSADRRRSPRGGQSSSFRVRSRTGRRPRAWPCRAGTGRAAGRGACSGRAAGSPSENSGTCASPTAGSVSNSRAPTGGRPPSRWTSTRTDSSPPSTCSPGPPRRTSRNLTKRTSRTYRTASRPPIASPTARGVRLARAERPRRQVLSPRRGAARAGRAASASDRNRRVQQGRR